MVLLLLLLVFSTVDAAYKKAPYASWAHDHMVWINGNDQNQEKMYQLVQGYQARNIPVGNVNIDSQWSECVNNFKVNTKKFPNMGQFIKDMHSKNIRVILWATSVINKECPEFQEGVDKHYFLNNGQTVKWWRGKGAIVDLYNPEARKWFEGLLDRILDLGADGFKVDGADPYVEFLRPRPYSPGLKKYISYRSYANACYGTFYNHTLVKNSEGLIMSRPVDIIGNIYFLKYSPKYMMFMGWVGDQANNAKGFQKAMTNVIHSASVGYLNFGYDIGGYLSRNPPMKWLFLRQTQLAAFLPYMENGGGGVHTPWSFDNETVEIYRYYVLLHYDLSELFLTAGTEAYQEKVSVLTPVEEQTNIINTGKAHNLGFVLWKSFLVAPIFDQNGFVQVVFPEGYNWIYIFNHSKIYLGGTKRFLGVSIQETACWMRSNSIIPFRKELWLVYLQKGRVVRSVIGRDYSYDLLVYYDGFKLELKVEMFFKDKSVEKSMSDIKTKIIRLIGVTFQDQHQRQDMIKMNNLQQTEYRNQFEYKLQLNKTVILEGIKFD